MGFRKYNLVNKKKINNLWNNFKFRFNLETALMKDKNEHEVNCKEWFIGINASNVAELMLFYEI